MKKIVNLVAVLLIFTMVFGMTSVLAADDSVKVLVETVDFDKAEATAKNGYYTVSVPINVIENTGFIAIKLDVEYDETFELVGWTEGTVFPYVASQEGVSGTDGLPASGKISAHNATSSAAEDLAKKPFTVYYVSTYEANNTSTGKLITLEFKVPEDTAVGNYPITATVVEAFSQSGTVSGTTVTPLPDDITSACTTVVGGIRVADTSNTFNIVAESTDAKIKDGFVEVDINLENNPGITKLGFTVEFNGTYLEFDGVTSYGVFAEADFDAIVAEDGSLYVYAESDTKVTASGTLVTLKFKYTDEVAAGTYTLDVVPNFKGDAKDGAYNGADYVTVEAVKPGQVTISSVLYGDADGNGVVNVNDVVRLKQYFARWSVTIDKANADADGNGVVNVNDVVRLQQYFARWNVQLGK